MDTDGLAQSPATPSAKALVSGGHEAEGPQAKDFSPSHTMSSEQALAYKPDAAQAIARMEAWWEGAILDRPTIQVTAPKLDMRPLPEKHHETLRERWMDVEHVVTCADVRLSNTYFGGEILPAFVPNLGPEIMTAAFGTELTFGEDTSWSVPCLHDWNTIPELIPDRRNPYVQTILGMTRCGLELGRGKFIVGITDLHPGGDLAASLRDPQQLCLDVITEPDQVHALMTQLSPSFTTFYEWQYRLLREAGQTITTSWLPLFTEGRYYIPSCDFSCMVSPRMFQEFFLPEIIEECDWLDRSIYHLDGPGALIHLDTILDIPSLDALQWVWGAGNEPASRWMHVFQHAQAKGKNLHINIEPWEINLFMEHLKPEGVMLCTYAGSVEEADALIACVSKWRSKS